MMVAYRQPNLRQRTYRRDLAQPDAVPALLLSPLFSASRDPLLLIDARQIIRALNPAASALLGFRAEKVRGRVWRRVFQLERELAQGWRRNPIVQCLHSRRNQTLAKDTVLVCEERRIPLTGQVLNVSAGQKDMVLLYLNVSVESAETHSVSRRNEHEMLLQHMSRLNTVSELATGIAHEINQPLAAIMSFNQAALRLLAEEEPDVDRVAEALAEAVSQTQRAAGILERLRSFVSRHELHFMPVAINQVVINALTLLSSKLTETSVRVNLRTEPCPPVHADALQLEQVMVNLVRNAIEAMQTTPDDMRRLQIATCSLAGQVHIEVTDSGPGLSASASRQLFTRFFTTKADGMGLGLSISRTILEAAGGELSASNSPAGGACFRITLPISSTEEVLSGKHTV
ncbi:MAG: ATP-binding protein [bacterium]|nr:ATP-binding protein [bacterium]